MGVTATAVAGALLLPGGPVATDTQPVAQSEASATVLAGVDRAGAGVDGTGELRIGVGTRRTLGPASWFASYGLLAQGWTAPLAADAHVLQLGASSPGRLGPGGLGVLRASLSQGWAEASLGVTASSVLPGSVRLWALAGPTLRGDAAQAALGIGGTLVARRVITPRLDVSGRLDARAWRGEDRVPWVADGDLSAAWAPRPRWSGWVDVGWSRIGGDPDTVSWAGLPGGGGQVVRALGSVGWTAVRGLDVVAEVRVEDWLGAGSPVRVRGLVGLTGSIGRLRGPGPVLHDPAGTWFEVVVPGAQEVMLVGSFNDWSPVPLVATGSDRWSVELPLPPGEHEYLFLVDGEPYVPPDAEQLRPDGFGGANAVIRVGPAPD